MQGLFSWEDDNDKKGISVYMPKTTIKALGPQGVGSMSFQAGTTVQPQQAQGLMQQPPPVQQPSLGGVKKKTQEEEPERPSETYQPDYSSHDTTNTQDPYNPNNYEYNQETGEFESKILEPFDPKNFEWDSVTGAPKYIGDSPWNPDHYQGTIYDPSNPFDLTEDEWVKMTGLLNSGSTLEEGLNLVKNSGLAGGLSDMGGVADEIVDQTGSGLLGTLSDAWQKISEYMPYIGLGKSIYDLFSGGEVTPESAVGAGTAALNAFSQYMSGVTLGPWGLVPMAMLYAGHALDNKPSREYFDPTYGMDLGDGKYLMLGSQVSKDDRVSYDDLGQEDNFWRNLYGENQGWGVLYDKNNNTFSRFDPYSLYDDTTQGALDPETYARQIYEQNQGPQIGFDVLNKADNRSYDQILEEVMNSQVQTPTIEDDGMFAYEMSKQFDFQDTLPEYQQRASTKQLFDAGQLSEDSIRQHALDAIENNQLTALQYGDFKGDPAVVNFSKKYPMMLSSLQAAYQQMANQYGWGGTANVKP